MGDNVMTIVFMTQAEHAHPTNETAHFFFFLPSEKWVGHRDESALFCLVTAFDKAKRKVGDIHDLSK
jgi:hypothetical protein